MKKQGLWFFLAVLLFLAYLEPVPAAPAPPAGRPKEVAAFQAHRGDINGLAFSPDSKTLASGGGDGKVKLWDAASSKNLVVIEATRPNARRGEIGRVFSVAFSPDGKTVASSGDDRELRLWDVASGNNTATISGKLVNLIGPLTFSPDGKRIICRENVYDFETQTDRPVMKGLKGWPIVVAFDPKGNLLLATSFSHPDPNSFVVWDVKTGKRKITCEGKDAVFHCAAFHPNGKTVVSIEGDHRRVGDWWEVALWDVADGKCTAKFRFNYPEFPYLPTFSPDGKILAVPWRNLVATARNDPGQIRLLDVSTGKVVANLTGHRKTIDSLAFSRDGRLLASGDGYGVIKIWRLPARYKAK